MPYDRSRVNVGVIALLTAVYFVAGKLGLALAFVHVSATAVWPPTGIALAAFIVLGYYVWPGIFLGAFLVNITTAGSIATTIGIAMGNTLEGLLGAYLVNRFANGRNAFERPQDILKFTVFAALISTMVSPTIGITSLCLGGYALWAKYGAIWFTWWLGDVGGALVVAPLLLLWSTRPRLHWNWRQVGEALLLLGLLWVVGHVIYCGLFHPNNKTYPLAIILQGIDYLSKRVDQQDDKTTVVLKYTNDAVRRADAVIRELLDFSITRELWLTPSDLNGVIEQALQLVKYEVDRSHITVITEFGKHLPRVRLDQNKMEQVFVNVLMNAIHAMSIGGTLTVRTSMKQLTDVDGDVGTRKGDRFKIGETVVLAEVDDTGTGIPEEILQKIFDPFFTTKPRGKGTGLGLTVTQKIVDLHRGMIAIRNRDEGGVKVAIVLRVDRAEPDGEAI